MYTHKVFIEPSLFQAEQHQLFNPFLTGELLQSLHHSLGSSLDSLQHVHISLALRSPTQGTALQVSPVLSGGPCEPLIQGHIISSQATWCPLDPRFFPVKLFSSWVAPRIFWCVGLFLSKSRTGGIPTSWGSCPPISPIYWGPSGQQHNPLLLQHFSQFFICCVI